MRAYGGGGRNADAAEDVVETLRDEGIDAEGVSCATTSREPLVHGAWLQPGAHLDLVGGFRRDMREADDAAVARPAPSVTADGRAGPAGFRSG